MYKVLVSDNISPKGIEILEQEADVTFNPDLSREEFLDIIGEYDGLIVRSMTEVDKEALDKARNLKVIGRAGTGYDNIDIEEASKRGIIVFNTPTGNTISAVEHTIGMMLALSRNIPQANQALHEGIWDRKKYMGVEVKGKTLGIIGLGRIGSRVAVRAQAFGMKVIANDPYLPPEKAAKINVPLLGFKEVLKKSDYITLHTPLTDETYHILSHKEFAIMKDNVRIINCARGKNVDTQALAKALAEHKVAGAAIDVHEVEPLPEDNPLLKYQDRVIMTCHLGGTTTEAMDNVSIAAAEQVLDVLNNGLPESPLNIPSINIQEYNKAKPYLNLVNKLGNFIAKWKGHERIEMIEAEYGGEVIGHDLKPFTTSLIKDILDPILDSRVNLVNAQLVAKERGIEIKESQISKPDGVNNIIRVRVKTNKGNYSVAGTNLPIGLRIIEINDFRIDLNLEGKFLVISYQDKPGVIGKVGSILGQDNVNIASMQVGRKSYGGQAIMIIQTDNKPSKATMEKINKNIELTDLTYLEI
ncbi:phosphoglycerate dehydrogenase [Halothermothrix orenii]|uniref:D-3-phosphoglycerate dehydrogenase n=1 Tax=Halothermothrix orenii (strain H 168 / OCM 544 / DSM 9562) TaxID=373903 RepID=B8CX87_HALOH|nr:phosphoglycerate dehydrogenase [Halothermothrix orenii]ACL69906.1 D-3-phosphoglycerate dehydrogenase [Halothermothrix orenii H 168]